MEKYFNKLAAVLMTEPSFTVEDKINKNYVSSLARQYDKKLLELLSSDKEISDLFFVDVNGSKIFKKDVFLAFINNKEFLPDSYTAYKSKIGLATDINNYISEDSRVILNWPYKECILEGGQDKEDQKRDEVFFNEILAPDQINTLLDDKVFTNWKRYDKDGEHELDKLKPNDNLIIKGNNLIVLHSLKKRFAGKVKLIYIDPPYNTGNDEFKYNDNFNHSTWLTFMKNRLEVARELLSEDGLIYVHCDYHENSYLRVLMDEIFGRDKLVREVIWFKGNTFGFAAGADNFVLSHDNIYMYSKTNKYKFNKLYEPYSEEYIKKRFTHDDNDGKGPYRIQGKNQKQYLNDSRGIPVPDVWQIPVVNVMAAERCFETQKPEAIMKRIIEASTDPGDIVLDFCMGSGTTLVVAHKMNRQYIGVEQMGYIDNISVNRLKRTIFGEASGISKDVNWTGGGSFVYCNIKNDANIFREKVRDADEKKLEKLLEEVLKSSFLSYRLDPKKVSKKEFEKLSMADKKRILIDLVDNNTLYLNYSEINDKTYNVSEADKKHNKEFYGE